MTELNTTSDWDRSINNLDHAKITGVRAESTTELSQRLVDLAPPKKQKVRRSGYELALLGLLNQFAPGAYYRSRDVHLIQTAIRDALYKLGVSR